jgi:putative DNA primase/helicase
VAVATEGNGNSNTRPLAVLENLPITDLTDEELRASKRAHTTGVAASRNEPTPDSQPALVTRTFDKIEPEPLRWLWPGVFPLGKLSLLVGDPGVGKSLITVDIAAHVSRGEPWCDGSACPMGRILLLSAEDDPADTIRPRLDAAGARVQSVHLIEGVPLEGGRIGDFDLSKDIGKLGELLSGNDSATVPFRVVIVDPISAYLGGADSHVNAAVRQILSPLASLAAKYRVAVLAVSHLNKSGGPAMYRATGSLAFTAAARSAWAVGKDPEDGARVLMMPIKQNLAEDTGGFAYRLVNVESEGAKIPKVEWAPQRVQGNADTILSQNGPRDQAAWQEAADWLRDRLAGGPVPVIALQHEAGVVGFRPKALRTAHDKLRIVSRKLDFSGGWCWSLPMEVPKTAEDAQDAQARETGIFEEGGHLRSPSPADVRFPSPTRRDAKNDGDIAAANLGSIIHGI